MKRLKFLILLAGMQAMPGLAVAAGRPATNLLDDWRPTSNSEQVCSGEYLPPEFPPATTAAPIAIEADSGTLALAGKSVFSGNVLIRDQSNRIFADSLSLFRNSNTEAIEWAEISGPLLIEQPGARLTGKFGKFIFQDQQITLNDTEFRLYDAHIRGQASSLSHALNTPYQFNNATYTTCEPGNNFWQLRAKQVTIDQQTGMGVAKHAKLLIHNVPILYSPYLTFPVGLKRKSGLLAPSYAVSNTNGTEINLPYYFNLAPNYDDTFTTSYLSKRGLLLHNEFRYLSPSRHGEINLQLLPHDEDFANFRQDNLQASTSDPTDPRVKALKRGQATRWYFSINDNAKHDIHWSSNLNYHYVSDDNLLSDLESRLADNNTWQLEQSATLNYEQANWHGSLQLQSFQILQPFDSNINEDPYRLLPQLTTTATLPIKHTPLDFTLRAQYTRFGHAPSPITGHKPTTGERIVFTPGLQLLYQTSYFYLQPAIKLETRLYRLDLDAANTTRANNDQNPHLVVPVNSLKTGLIFEREGKLGNLPYGQSLEAQLFYQYSPYHNQDELPIFDTSFSPITFSSYLRANRFVGGDRIGDSNRLGYALLSDYWENTSGETLGHWEFGQLVYFDKRKVSICNLQLSADCIRQENPSFKQRQSNYFFSGHWQGDTRNHWQLNTELDSSGFSLRTLQLQWTHQLDDQHILSIGYLSSKELAYQNARQLNTAFAWHLTPRWNILGRWYYDITENLSIDTFAGLEYENCCWALWLGKQRSLKLANSRRPFYDDQIFFEFMLKGLSGYGDSHAKLAEAVIPGYIDHFGQFKVNK